MHTETLIVLDDDQENAEIIAYYFERHNFTVTKYTDPLQFLLDIDNGLKAKTLLLDIHMPLIDGFSLLDILKQKYCDFFKSCNIIALTALAFDKDEERCLKAGADYYISKPFKLEYLVSFVQDLQPKKCIHDNE